LLRTAGQSRRRSRREAAEQGDEADEPLRGARRDGGASSCVPPLRGGTHRFAAYPRCSADVAGRTAYGEPSNEGARLKELRGTTWRRICAAAVALPGVQEGTSYSTPALHVRKTLLARLREDGETVAVKVELLDREVLLEADPRAFFVTDHYLAYPFVLVRLAEAQHGVVMELLEQAWLRGAPKALVAGRDAGRSGAVGQQAERTKRRQRRRRTRG
jgi:hypothetical protein